GFIEIPYAGAPHRDLYAYKRVYVRASGRGLLHPYLTPVGFKLIGNDHRQGGPDPLAHFGTGYDNGDNIVRRELEEGIGREDSLSHLFGTEEPRTQGADRNRDGKNRSLEKVAT